MRESFFSEMDNWDAQADGYVVSVWDDANYDVENGCNEAMRKLEQIDNRWGMLTEEEQAEIAMEGREAAFEVMGKHLETIIKRKAVVECEKAVEECEKASKKARTALITAKEEYQKQINL